MDFKFPIPPGYQEEPVWKGNGFSLSSGQINILRYTECQLGWDSNLTDFHEKEANEGNQYIDRASRIHAIKEVERLIKITPSIILEVGSSSGYLIRDIKNHFPEHFVIGSDCIYEPLEAISEKSLEVPLIQFDLTNCPLPDNCIDFVIALNVLEHIHDDNTALKQVYRILKPGGYAIIEVPSNPQLFDFYDEHLKHFRRYRMVDLQEMAFNIGFLREKSSHLGFILYPAFKFFKLRNKNKETLNSSQSETSMKQLINLGGPIINDILLIQLRLELLFGRIFQYPIGIRCLLTLKKSE
jgi:ubiquinone/menaquinone biosynthesis C-methylase UbiE